MEPTISGAPGDWDFLVRQVPAVRMEHDFGLERATALPV